MPHIAAAPRALDHPRRDTGETAFALWRRGEPLRAGTPGWSFACAITGTRADMAGFGALRGHEAVLNLETQKRYPALLVALHDHHGAHVATLVTWLAPDARGLWRRAPLLRPQVAMGSPVGAALRAWRCDAFPPLPRALAGAEAVTITRSVGLALRLGAADRTARTLAVLTGGNVAALRLPDSVRSVTLAAFPGEPPHAAIAFARCATRLRAEGRIVRIVDQTGAPLALGGVEP